MENILVWLVGLSIYLHTPNYFILIYIRQPNLLIIPAETLPRMDLISAFD